MEHPAGAHLALALSAGRRAGPQLLACGAAGGEDMDTLPQGLDNPFALVGLPWALRPHPFPQRLPGSGEQPSSVTVGVRLATPGPRECRRSPAALRAPSQNLEADRSLLPGSWP